MSTDLPSGMGSEVLDSAPLVIRESLIFPYIDGLIFIYHIKTNLGWDGVNGVYQDPPDST